MAIEKKVHSTADERFGFSINLTVRNEWENIDTLRISVQNCFHAVFSDVDGCHAVAMVTGELMENAIKYGDWTDPNKAPRFSLRVTGDASRSIIIVSSPVNTEGVHLPKLMRTLVWLQEQESPHAAYQKKLLAIAADSSSEDSGLGLARMGYEGNCTFSASVDDGILTIRAEMAL